MDSDNRPAHKGVSIIINPNDSSDVEALCRITIPFNPQIQTLCFSLMVAQVWNPNDHRGQLKIMFAIYVTLTDRNSATAYSSKLVNSF